MDCHERTLMVTIDKLDWNIKLCMTVRAFHAVERTPERLGKMLGIWCQDSNWLKAKVFRTMGTGQFHRNEE